MTKEYLSDDWKASMQLSFDFNHMMADFAADARAAVRSDLRKAAHNLEGKDLEKVQEAVAVLSAAALEEARSGKTVEEVMAETRKILSRNDVMEGVVEMIPTVQVEAVFTDGSRLITIHNPIN